MIEPRSHQRLRLDAFDVEFDLAELDVDADAQFHQVEDFRVQRDPSHHV